MLIQMSPESVLASRSASSQSSTFPQWAAYRGAKAQSPWGFPSSEWRSKMVKRWNDVCSIVWHTIHTWYKPSRYVWFIIDLPTFFRLNIAFIKAVEKRTWPNPGRRSSSFATEKRHSWWRAAWRFGRHNWWFSCGKRNSWNQGNFGKQQKSLNIIKAFSQDWMVWHRKRAMCWIRTCLIIEPGPSWELPKPHGIVVLRLMMDHAVSRWCQSARKCQKVPESARKCQVLGRLEQEAALASQEAGQGRECLQFRSNWPRNCETSRSGPKESLGCKLIEVVQICNCSYHDWALIVLSHGGWCQEWRWLCRGDRGSEA